MALTKQEDYRKIRCKYGLREYKYYTFLTTGEIAEALKEGDFVLVDSKQEFAIVQVVDETEAPLSDSINYKHIIKIL